MINERYAKSYCKEDISLIENYDKAVNDTKKWDCHHRDEIRILPSGMKVIRSKQDLIDNDRYYNCPANELIFLTHTEHQILHNKNRKVGGWKLQFTEEHKNKLSESMKGNLNCVGRIITTSTKDKISESLKKSSKFKEFIKDQGERNTKNFTGRHWYNDGIKNFFIFDKDKEPNYKLGRTYHHRRKK